MKGDAFSDTAFTMVELLIASLLMAMVAMAVIAVLAGGIRVWERSFELRGPRQNAMVAFSRMRRDLLNVRRFAPVVFEGNYDRFTCAVVSRDIQGPDEGDEVGRLGYYLKGSQNFLCRSFVPYPSIRSQAVTDRCQEVLEGVTRIRFTYFGKDEETGKRQWQQHWKSPSPPLAIRSEVEIQTNRHATDVFSFMIFLGVDIDEDVS